MKYRGGKLGRGGSLLDTTEQAVKRQDQNSRKARTRS
jgi:hypothetical protein